MQRFVDRSILHAQTYPVRNTPFLLACAAIAWTALVFTSAPVHAITVRLCECSTSEPDFNPGSSLNLGFRIEGDPGEEIYGLGLSVYGYNESVIDFQSGNTVASIFHGVVIPAVGAFNGLGNTLTNPLAESSIGASGNRVSIFNGDGVVGAGGRTYHSNMLALTVIPGYAPCPIPEPTTSLLLGLGLAALALEARAPAVRAGIRRSAADHGATELRGSRRGL